MNTVTDYTPESARRGRAVLDQRDALRAAHDLLVKAYGALPEEANLDLRRAIRDEVLTRRVASAYLPRR